MGFCSSAVSFALQACLDDQLCHATATAHGNSIVKQQQKVAAAMASLQTANVGSCAGVMMNVWMYNCVLAACKVPPAQTVPVSSSHLCTFHLQLPSFYLFLVPRCVPFPKPDRNFVIGRPTEGCKLQQHCATRLHERSHLAKQRHLFKHSHALSVDSQHGCICPHVPVQSALPHCHSD